MHNAIYAAIIIVLLVLILYKREHFNDGSSATIVKTTDNYVRLYETFAYRSNPPDARSWEFGSNGQARIKKALKMYLKSYDIKVKSGKVQLWAIYPDETTASSSSLGVSGFGDAYTDAMPLITADGKDPVIQIGQSEYNPPGWQHTYTTNAYRANENKYKLIAEASSGDRLKGTLDFKCTRVMVIADFF
jgi:hypothetical protein